jgi:ParB family chromosome partitioning protein
MSNRRSALGRGLGALIAPPQQQKAASSAPAAPAVVGSVVTTGPGSLPVDLIDPNPEQPRRFFDPDQLERLAASILQHGVLQPVVVRQAGDRYELIVGERRWRASRAAGLKEIPAVVADFTEQARLEVAIVENVQRHDLNPMELAHAFRALADTGVTQEEIGRKVSMDRSSIANHLRLLDLGRDLQEDVEQGRLSMGHAKALLQVTHPERRLHLRDRVIGEGLSVRATEQLGRKIAGPVPGRAPAKPKAPTPLDPDLRRLLEAIQARLQTRVRLAGNAQQGRLEIDFTSGADLERITQMLLGEA